MTNIPYIAVVTTKIPVLKKDVIFYISRNEWMWRRHKFDNHNMALMLVEILYSRNQINEATYRKIMRKYHIQNRIA